MSVYFDRVAIVGVGLLGGSLGIAMKHWGLAGRVAGVGRRASSLDTACDMRAIDEAHLELAPAVTDADLVVLCTPAAKVVAFLDEVRDCVRPATIVTDVASTKGALCARARESWPKPRRFVGSHPMAGSEKFGPQHARADFYKASVCLVEQADDLDAEARERVVALWEAVGARVVGVDAAAHDMLLARTSHLPHVVAAAIAQLAGRQGDVRDVIGNGFRDTTRIASGRPELWTEICLTNREAVLAGLDEFSASLARFRTALEKRDATGLAQFFEDGNSARRRAVGA